MNLEHVPFLPKWRALTVALACVPVLSGAAPAAEQSLPSAVTGAFETIVIDATAAAAKASEAAADALGTKPPKKKNKKSKEPPSPAAAKTDPSAAKTDTQKTDTQKKEPSKGEADKTGDPKPAADAVPAQPAPAGAAQTAPATKADEAAKAAKKGPPTEWPAVEVELARARCTQLLKGIDAVTVPEAPFRKGDCGTMAPVRLMSIGKSPEVSFSPPPVVTCDLVVGLVKWLKTDVQPAARRHLGSEVVRVESMSDYSCRMAYGRVGNKLSEHGKANALDIRGFTTRKGQEAVVLSHWGETKRDVRRQLAAAKAAAEQAEAVKAAAELAAKERAEAAEFAAKSTTTGTPLPRKTLVEGVPPKREATLALPASVARDGPVADGFGAAARNFGAADPEGSPGKGARKKEQRKKAKGKPDGTVAALPGGKPLDDGVQAPPPATPTARFLHEIHAGGCRIFGTTLGPEVNEAHRNHFHVDMAERKFRKICD
jgi:hypothetical protein